MADPLEDVQAALQRAIADRSGNNDQAAAMRQVGIMIGMAVRALTEKAQATAAEQTAMRDMLQQLSASAADIVALMEAHGERKPDHSEQARALADAIAGLKLPAPRVQVDVQPAQVSVPQPRVDVTVQPAPVTVQQQADSPGQQWRIEIERAGKNPTAPISALIVTRL